MTTHFDTFDIFTQYLIDNGWVERKPMSFVKYGIELFFDNSNAVEIYPSNDSNNCIADVRILTVADLAALECDIKNGRYQPKSFTFIQRIRRLFRRFV